MTTEISRTILNGKKWTKNIWIKLILPITLVKISNQNDARNVSIGTKSMWLYCNFPGILNQILLRMKQIQSHDKPLTRTISKKWNKKQKKSNTHSDSTRKIYLIRSAKQRKGCEDSGWLDVWNIAEAAVTADSNLVFGEQRVQACNTKISNVPTTSAHPQEWHKREFWNRVCAQEVVLLAESSWACWGSFALFSALISVGNIRLNPFILFSVTFD